MERRAVCASVRSAGPGPEPPSQGLCSPRSLTDPPSHNLLSLVHWSNRGARRASLHLLPLLLLILFLLGAGCESRLPVLLSQLENLHKVPTHKSLLSVHTPSGVRLNQHTSSSGGGATVWRGVHRLDEEHSVWLHSSDWLSAAANMGFPPNRKKGGGEERARAPPPARRCCSWQPPRSSPQESRRSPEED